MKRLSPNMLKIINELNDGLYHNGTTIGEHLHITRSAVWKTIKKLESYGIKLNSIKGKGYALTEPLILLEADKIKSKLHHQDVEIDIFESIDSTQEYCKRIELGKKARFCLAEQQTQGHGRFNRNWYSPFGQNIYLSCLYPFKQDISELIGLGFVISLAVLETLRKYSGLEFLIKWPNDILYDHKKLAGCVIEVQAESQGICKTIIGIGINVNLLQDDANIITQNWTSLRKITNNYIDRNHLVASLIDNLLMYIQNFQQQKLAPYLAHWQKFDYLIDKNVSLCAFDKTINGIAKGIDEQGHLLLQLANGNLQAFASGDTSVKSFDI